MFRPGWRSPKVITTGQPFILRRGRKVIASISGKRGLCRKLGASPTSMTMFHSRTLPRPARVYVHTLVVATGRTIGSIMVKTWFSQKNKTRFWRSWPSSAVLMASVSTTTHDISDQYCFWKNRPSLRNIYTVLIICTLWFEPYKWTSGKWNLAILIPLAHRQVFHWTRSSHSEEYHHLFCTYAVQR